MTLLAVADLPDYDNNGLVDLGDLDLALAHWGSELSDPASIGWINSQPSGTVDQTELDGVLVSCGKRSAVSSAAVPQPASFALLGVGLLPFTWCGTRRTGASRMRNVGRESRVGPRKKQM